MRRDEPPVAEKASMAHDSRLPRHELEAVQDPASSSSHVSRGLPPHGLLSPSRSHVSRSIPRQQLSGVSKHTPTSILHGSTSRSRSGSIRRQALLRASGRTHPAHATETPRRSNRRSNRYTAPSLHTPLLANINLESMSYRGVDIRHNHRPLIDFIPDGNLYVDDEDDDFYQKDEDYIIHPKWKAMGRRFASRIPRRLKRYFFVYLLLSIILVIAWRAHFGPRYARYREQQWNLNNPPKMSYGSNVRPEFKDLIHIKTMDEKHVPVDKQRLMFVGDVHGCIDELKELLKKVDFKVDSDHLVLTGDIIAKGPNSAGVVAVAQKLGASCVRGNHEDKLLLSIAETEMHHAELPGADENFIDESHAQGGDYKLRKLAKQFSKDQIQWLKECPVILRVGQLSGIGEVLVVHGGLVPGIPLEKQDSYQCMNMRTIDLKTRLPSENRDGTEWEKLWNHYQKKQPASERQTVIYGHDAKRGKNIEKYSKGLDSNCVRGGHLTALVIDAHGKEKYHQVKCKGYVQ